MHFFVWYLKDAFANLPTTFTYNFRTCYTIRNLQFSKTMAVHKQLCLAFALITLLLAGQSTGEEVTITNRCSGRLLVRTTGANRGPFFLNAGGSTTLGIQRNVVPTPRIEAVLNCDGSGHNCDADGNYKSLAEFHWDPSGKTW